MKSAARLHGIKLSGNPFKSTLVQLLWDHICNGCKKSLFNLNTNKGMAILDVDYTPDGRMKASPESRDPQSSLECKTCNIATTLTEPVPFPPVPLSSELSETIVRDFCSDLSPSSF